MNLTAKIQQYHQSKIVLALCIAIETAILYGLISWAIDSGRLLVYFLAIVVLGFIVSDAIRLIKLTVKNISLEPVTRSSKKR